MHALEAVLFVTRHAVAIQLMVRRGPKRVAIVVITATTSGLDCGRGPSGTTREACGVKRSVGLSQQRHYFGIIARLATSVPGEITVVCYRIAIGRFCLRPCPMRRASLLKRSRRSHGLRIVIYGHRVTTLQRPLGGRVRPPVSRLLLRISWGSGGRASLLISRARRKAVTIRIAGRGQT